MYVVIIFEHKKKLLQDEAFVDPPIVVPYFLHGRAFDTIRNSAFDTAAQNDGGLLWQTFKSFTKLFCRGVFDILEQS